MKTKIFMMILVLTLILTPFITLNVYGAEFVKGRSIVAEDQVKASIGLNFPELDITWLDLGDAHIQSYSQKDIFTEGYSLLIAHNNDDTAVGLVKRPENIEEYNDRKIIRVFIDNNLLDFEDTDPIIENSRTLVPMRAIFEALGAEVFLFIKEDDDERLYTTIKKEEFIQHLNKSYSDLPPAQKVPFFVEVKDGRVISITEKIEFTI